MMKARCISYKLYHNYHKFKKEFEAKFIPDKLKKIVKIQIEPSKVTFLYNKTRIFDIREDWYTWYRYGSMPERADVLSLYKFLDFYELYNNLKYSEALNIFNKVCLGEKDSIENDIFIFLFSNHTTDDEFKKIWKILILLDHRTGKRTLQKLIDSGDYFSSVILNYDPVIKQLYEIRCGIENIKLF